jgi:hypothetical protein
MSPLIGKMQQQGYYYFFSYNVHCFDVGIGTDLPIFHSSKHSFISLSPVPSLHLPSYSISLVISIFLTISISLNITAKKKHFLGHLLNKILCMSNMDFYI